MKMTPIEYGLIAALGCVGSVTALEAYGVASHPAPTAVAAPVSNPHYPWHLVETLTFDQTRHEDFVIDEFASMGDCYAALASTSNRYTYRSQRISFACELEGAR